MLKNKTIGIILIWLEVVHLEYTRQIKTEPCEGEMEEPLIIPQYPAEFVNCGQKIYMCGYKFQCIEHLYLTFYLKSVPTGIDFFLTSDANVKIKALVEYPEFHLVSERSNIIDN